MKRELLNKASTSPWGTKLLPINQNIIKTKLTCLSLHISDTCYKYSLLWLNTLFFKHCSHIVHLAKISKGDGGRGSIQSSSSFAFICEYIYIAFNLLSPPFHTCIAHSHLIQKRLNFAVNFFHIERLWSNNWTSKNGLTYMIKPGFFLLSYQWCIILNNFKGTKITIWSTKFCFWLVCLIAAEIWYNSTITRSTKNNKLFGFCTHLLFLC